MSGRSVKEGAAARIQGMLLNRTFVRRAPRSERRKASMDRLVPGTPTLPDTFACPSAAYRGTGTVVTGEPMLGCE